MMWTIVSRPIQIPFVCDQRGDCCRETPYIVVSRQEAEVLGHAAQGLGAPLWFRPHTEAGFRQLCGQPCPFLQDNQCRVYDVRPYNCRRFICGRPSGSAEPWDMRVSGECVNFTARVSQSVTFYRHACEVQAAAQPWAVAHGWTP